MWGDKMDKIVKINYERWLNSPRVSNEDKETLRKMSEIERSDAFFKDLEFGTAGLRGVLGPGTNRMNEHVVKKATVAFGLYIKEKFKDGTKKGVALSHDNRHHSRDFTLEASKILNDMGIDTYIFDSLRPTPELSYAVRYQGCVGGIMITASHNPKEYNGYKVYDETGCQIVPLKIARLIEIIGELPDELSIAVPSVEEKGVEHTFAKDVDDTYVKLVEGIQINPDLNKKNFKIVYTPNHGTSYVNAMRVFKDLGYEVYPVLSQCDPDPDFSGTLSPNPEDPRSFIEPIKLAKKIDADLICMTDPDGDRVGLATKLSNGEYRLLTGNESAAILLDYILSERKKRGDLPKDGVVYNTVVTSSLGAKIATSYGVKTESFLTGFKYIGERIHHYEELGKGPEFLFGYEESYGCLIAPFVRDKDGIQAILMYCEMALFYHQKGFNLVDVYDSLAKRYGYYRSKLFNIYFNGEAGAKKMKEIMEEIEEHPLTSLLGNKIKYFEDYFKLQKKDLDNGKTYPIENLMVGDLVKFIFEDNTNIAIRPSGTEPKCKFYIEVVGKNEKDTEGVDEKYYEALLKRYKIDAQ
jgi:phosphoglucomutase